MKLTQLYLQHFRNISGQTLQFSPGVNIFVGQNGQGKTNVIESIFSLSLSRPFRSREKEVFVEYEAEFARVRGEVEVGKDEKETLEIFWENLGKKNSGTVFQKNGVKKSSTEFLKSKHFFAVLFAPEDMDIPFTSPKNRRTFLSRILSPLFPDYLTATMKYEKVLRHRNKLLSDFPHRKIQKMEFHFWDSELSKWSEIIENYRQQFFVFVQERIAEKYRLISQKEETLEIHSKPSVPKGGNLFDVLEKNFSQDVRFGSTQKGPHRDDFELQLRGKPLSETASRGEVRSSIIALKLCEREFIAEHMSLFPVLLLDDVFSELDEFRRNALLEFFQDEQVFISTTDIPKLSKGLDMKVFEVKNGRVQQKKSK